jgi:hypothetical protein
MDIWNSFEAKFTPFPHSKAAREVDEFFTELADRIYDSEHFKFDCSVSVSCAIYAFTTDGDTNPKEFVPAIAQLIASLGGEGDIRTEYVTTIMEVL